MTCGNTNGMLTQLGSTLNTPVDHADCDFFPIIHTLLCIMGTLPVTSCECECSISMLTEEHNGTRGVPSKKILLKILHVLRS